MPQDLGRNMSKRDDITKMDFLKENFQTSLLEEKKISRFYPIQLFGITRDCEQLFSQILWLSFVNAFLAMEELTKCMHYRFSS